VSLRHDILLLLACFLGCAVAVGANRVDTVLQLTKVDSWRVRAGDEKNLALSESGGHLGVRFAYAKDEQARLELNFEPGCSPLKALRLVPLKGQPAPTWLGKYRRPGPP